MASFWKPRNSGSSKKAASGTLLLFNDMTTAGTATNVTLEESVGQELQWVDSDGEDTAGSLVEGITRATRKKLRFGRKKKDDLLSRVIVLPDETTTNSRIDNGSWWGTSKQVVVEHDAASTGSPPGNDRGAPMEMPVQREESAPKETKTKKKSRRFRKSKGLNDEEDDVEAAAGDIAILPTTSRRRSKKKKKDGKKADSTSNNKIQYFQAQIVTNEDSQSEYSHVSTDVESVKAYEEVSARLKKIDEKTLDSFGTQYREPLPADEDIVGPRSPNRPTFVAAPKLDARVMTAESWESLAGGGSLQEVLTRTEQKVKAKERETRDTGTQSLDGSFLGRKARAVKERFSKRRVVKQAQKKAAQETQEDVLVPMKADPDGDGDSGIVWTVTSPMTLHGSDSQDKDDGDDDASSVLTMDEALEPSSAHYTESAGNQKQKSPSRRNKWRLRK